MVAVADEAKRAQLAVLFDSPSVEGMVALSWEDFEDFVQAVFERAGYHVTKVASHHHRHHVDLDLRHKPDGKVVAQVEVRRYSTANIIKARVLQFVGALASKKVPQGYIVTTADFTQPAYAVSQENKGRVVLVNGPHFVRYIRYVQGSRLTGSDAEGPNVHQPLIPPDHLFDADAVARRDPRTSTVLAIANNKGGVAKTTTALNLAFALAGKRGHRVLLVDMEGQSSLTKAFMGTASLPRSLLDYFTQQRPLADLVLPTAFERVWLLPADERLFLYEPSPGQRTEGALAFARAIHDPLLVAPDGSPFDWIILDTPPTQDFLTRLALAASHYVVLPAMAETQAVFGANRALATTKTMAALMGAEMVQAMGGVVTRWKKSALAEQMLVGLVDILQRNGSRLLTTRIREDPNIEKAHQKVYGGKHTTLFHLGRHESPGAQDYAALMEEVLTHANHN